MEHYDEEGHNEERDKPFGCILFFFLSLILLAFIMPETIGKIISIIGVFGLVVLFSIRYFGLSDE